MSNPDIMCEVEIADAGIVEVVDSDHFRDIDGVSYEHYAVGGGVHHHHHHHVVDDDDDNNDHFEEVTCETEGGSSPGLMLQQMDDGNFSITSSFFTIFQKLNSIY